MDATEPLKKKSWFLRHKLVTVVVLALALTAAYEEGLKYFQAKPSPVPASPNVPPVFVWVP